jgi:hypothetical protein
VTVEVKEEDRHDETRVRVSASGFESYSIDLPFADRNEMSILLDPQ